MPFSVVIITKNEELNIERLLQSVKNSTDDIVIYDSNSTDKTIEIAKRYSANIITGEWLGFGATKNIANNFAKHNWVLSLDADEELNEELKSELKNIDLNENCVYEIKRNTVWRGKQLNFGIFLTEKKIRLFNKANVCWNDALAHEQLIYTNFKIIKLKGKILHYSYTNKKHALETHDKYAKLMAEQYFKNNKKANYFAPYIHAGFDWIKNVIFKLGFLDGAKGIEYCNINAQYVFKKYKYLLALQAK